MKLAKWFWKAWPVILVGILISVHFIIVYCYPQSLIEYSKFISLVLPIIGGLLVLYSIDSNLGIIKKNNLIDMLLNYLKEFPLIKKNLTVNARAAINLVSGFDAVLTHNRNPQTIEEKIEYLQEQMIELKNVVEKQSIEFSENIEKVANELKSSIKETKKDLSHIKTQIEEVSIGGVKVQFFGVLLVIYGSTVGYIVA